MSAPKIFGCPLWYGKIKNRVAKKHLFGVLRMKWYIDAMANYKVGDLINSCTTFNSRIGEINPNYFKVGNGFVLSDIDLTSDEGGSCSMQHCGVEPAWSLQKIMAYWEEAKKYYEEYGDGWGFLKRCEFTTIDEFGCATFDSQGYKNKYGDG